MNGLNIQEPLDLEVTDFGPIVEAKIDLRPLTVFVGPSNTGKSYLAILIYALHRVFSGDEMWRSSRHFASRHRMLRRNRSKNLSQKAITAIWELLDKLVADRKVLKSGGNFVLHPPVLDAIHSAYAVSGNQFGNEFDRCYGIDAGTLIRKGSRKGTRLAFRKPLSNDSAPIEYELEIKANNIEYGMTIPQDASIQIDVEKGNMLMENFLFESNELVAMGRQGAEEKHEIAWYLMDALCDLAWPQLTGPLYRPAFYLPADRTGVMHAHRVVVSAMIGSARMTGLRPTGQTPMLSGVLADFLQQLIDIDHPPSGRRKKQGDLGSSIEESILGGSVRVDRSEMIDYPHFTYKPRGWKEPLHLMNASSMVSELAPVVLYLRHVVERGNLLIVEEPESHLHPAMQVEFTRQLAKLIQKGVRVIITTHSEWILEELANVVRRSELPDSRRQEVPQGNYSLRSDQVGVWLFKPQLKPKGSLVEEIPIDDSGLFPSGFEEVATALHNDWAEISR